jgi:hypothetical protein
MHVEQPELTPFRSERFVVCVGVGGERRKLLQIGFSRSDGSVFVSFPYYEHTEGLVSVGTLAPGATTMDLAAEGKITSHLVKYSHHPDGQAHFSQDGKVLTRVRRQSVPLDKIDGHCFTSQVQGLGSFARLDAPEYDAPPTARRTTLTFDFQAAAPEAVKIAGYLYNAARLAGGPVVLTENAQGDKRVAFLVAPVATRAGAERILMLICEGIPAMTKHERSVLTFIGGFDTHAIASNQALPTSVLALAYPATNAAQLRESIGSIDLPRGEGG